MRPITTRAPAKVILFGEHAVNRGQPALATSVGLYVTCASGTLGPPQTRTSRSCPSSAACVTRRVSGRRDRLPGDVDRFQQSPRGARCGATGRLVHPAGGGHHRAEVLRLGREIDAWRAAGDLEPIRRLAGADYFAPAKYVLAGALGEALPGGGDRPGQRGARAGGLGSGGRPSPPWPRPSPPGRKTMGPTGWRAPGRRRMTRSAGSGWAGGLTGGRRRPRGVASRLDTQASLCGGVIRFTVAAGMGNPSRTIRPCPW